jgi:carboxymethylenebutenolidase
MTEDEKNQQNKNDIARREFVGLSVAAGLAATAGPASAKALEVVETNVDIKTPDGICDAAFIHPKSGSHAGVLIWPDAFGLRPSMRDMAKRLAADGYSVLVPNPFYRVAKAPFADGAPPAFSFANPADRGKITPLMASVNAPGNPEKDAIAFIGFLDEQKQVNKKKKIGTQGYCMGGPLVVRTAAALPDRIGAGGSFHGGGLVGNDKNSPHLLAPKIKARMYFGIAANDDKTRPDAKDKLKESFGAAKVPAEIEVYSMSQHGWCVPDMPKNNGVPIYNKEDAERAWAKLLALYKAGLA